MTDRTPSETGELNPEQLQAVESFFRNNAERILAVSSPLRKARYVIEAQVRGGSMGSTLPHESRVRIRLSDQESYQIGQVIALLEGTQFIVHRLVHRGRQGRAKNYLITQGDDRWFPDTPINVESVLGPVTEFQSGELWLPLGVLPNRPWAQRFLSSIILIMLACILEVNARLAQWLVARLAGLGVKLVWTRNLFAAVLRRMLRKGRI